MMVVQNADFTTAKRWRPIRKMASSGWLRLDNWRFHPIRFRLKRVSDTVRASVNFGADRL
jgi:hypothetical protein